MSESDNTSSTSSDLEMSGDSSLLESDLDIGAVKPYQDEPLASETSSDSESDADIRDLDKISREVLEQRFDRVISVQNWCTCGHCSDERLVGSMEFRCCQEVDEAVGKYTLEGLDPACITSHPHYRALTERVVLEQVAPLLKRKDGRTMKRGENMTMNEFLRAVAYRFIIRWLCGSMGWDNTRPLPACIYHEILARFSSPGAQTGYLTAENRD